MVKYLATQYGCLAWQDTSLLERQRLLEDYGILPRKKAVGRPWNFATQNSCLAWQKMKFFDLQKSFWWAKNVLEGDDYPGRHYKKFVTAFL